MRKLYLLKSKTYKSFLKTKRSQENFLRAFCFANTFEL